MRSSKETRATSDRLLHAALALSREHDPDRILHLVVAHAASLTGSRYAALAVYSAEGEIRRFVHRGVDVSTAARLGRTPVGRGLLGALALADGPLRLADLTRDPRFNGFPPHHPPMRAFLGAPLVTAAGRHGNLYVAERGDGSPYDDADEQAIVTLAAFAAAAVDSADLLTAERGRLTAVAEAAAARERERLHEEMLTRIIQAQEAERARVARDLHDEVGQALTSVLLGLRLVDSDVSADPPHTQRAVDRMAEVRGLVADALRQVRRLAFELRPTVLDDIGLVPALQRLCDETASRHGLEVPLRTDGLGDDTRLPTAVETVAYRVVQEALTNVARHASAQTAWVRVRLSGERLFASIRDDGVGFDPSRVGPSALGLAGMRERAVLARGAVEIQSERGTGSCVRLVVPVG